MSIDKLQDKIRSKKNPTVAGLDPTLELLPPHILAKNIELYGKSLEAVAESYLEFGCAIIDALHDIVPAIKPQSAYYEAIGPLGSEVLKKHIDYAKERELFVILDGKRNDIGSTAEAYSRAYLGKLTLEGQDLEPYGCDGLTINGYLGSDGIKPFIKDCAEHDKCIFLLVKTSNPSSTELQDMIAGDRIVYKVMGDLAERLGKDYIGGYGFSLVGAVAGATYPSDMLKLRKWFGSTFFLVPGYGAQGGTAEDISYAFNKFGHGAIVNSSRGILGAWKKSGGEGHDYADAARQAALDMKVDIKSVVTVV